MADTPKYESALLAFDEERDNFRRALASKGFSDDGRVLRGPVGWVYSGNDYEAIVDITLGDTFPFAAPKVDIIAFGKDVAPTFHIEREGNLCLWSTQVDVHNAPWRDPEELINKISGWFVKTVSGWPGDDDADLERYLPQDDAIILYDSAQVEAGHYYRLEGRGEILRVQQELRWSPSPSRKKNRGVRRRERRLLWVVDVGEVSHPVTTWADLVDLAGSSLEYQLRLIGAGSIEYILVKYRRGDRRAALVLRVTGVIDGSPRLSALESADASLSTRTLRSGDSGSRYKNHKVAIVGCGAIGSHIADTLFKSGVRRITLLDPERLRPGNLIRHLADNRLVGMPKTLAVRAELAAVGVDVGEVRSFVQRVSSPKVALKLLNSHDLVIDATADSRATALLRWAAEKLDKHMISVCLQRDGGLARVDRFPLWEGEEHLASIPIEPGSEEAVYEMGCGSPISKTPPLSVIKAAALGSQVALDDLNMWRSPPATIIEIIEPQNDDPYKEAGILKANEVSFD